MNKNNITATAKTAVLWALIGMAATFLLSLAGSAVAIRVADPLKAAMPVAVLCAGFGAALSAFGAVRAKRALGAGFCSGGVYALVLLICSLWGENSGPWAPWTLIACAAGTVLGAIAAKGRKESTAKRLKRLSKKIKAR